MTVADCDDGSYGVNCAETCGHCAGSETCHKETGACSGGCQQWYVTLDTDGHNTCKGHIGNYTIYLVTLFLSH